MTKQLKEVSIFNVEDTPYSNKINTFLTSIVGKKYISDEKEVLNLLEKAFYSDSHTRFGPMPELEDRVKLRSIIDSYVKEERPIPILIPWGSIKAQFGENIDIAEYMAIKQIIHLKERVKEIYEKGIEAIIRIEDTSGYSLFKLEGDNELVHTGTELYSNNLQLLVNILGDENSIWCIKESEMINNSQFEYLTDLLTPLFERYLADTDNLENFKDHHLEDYISFKALKEQGWSGLIPKVQRDHYYSAYYKLYSGDKLLMRRRLAMYFAGSLTRHKLDMTGKQKYWDHGFIQLAFVPPIPGIPNGYNSNYVYYRTVPENFTRNHMPPWRSKGYLAISDNGTLSIKPKLTTWNDKKDYYKQSHIISSPVGEVKIQSDYILT